ncbi:hypothetical protein V6U90_10730 [Micromonospora sp. CPCC 206060]
MTSTRFLPLLVSVEDEQVGPDHLLDDFADSLRVAYSFGPPYGERLVTWADLDALRVNRRALRRAALDNLDAALDGLRVHGQPPALMLSFAGLECSVLLVDEFWADLRHSVPGQLVVGVPARDVVIVTSSLSVPGLEKVRRGVDRVFFAGGAHLLSRDLLIWRDGVWQPFTPGGPAPSGPPPVPAPRPAESGPSGPANRPVPPQGAPSGPADRESYPERRAPWPGEGRQFRSRSRPDPPHGPPPDGPPPGPAPGTHRPSGPTR